MRNWLNDLLWRLQHKHVWYCTDLYTNMRGADRYYYHIDGCQWCDTFKLARNGNCRGARNV